MTKHVLFVHGAGQGAYAADAKLVASLEQALGPGYAIRYPAMPDEDSPDDKMWTASLAQEVAALGERPVLVGHSAGAATLLMYLANARPQPLPAGIFLLAPPFCGKGGWDCGEFVTPNDLESKLPEGVPVFFYHGRDDEIVPFAHMALHAKLLPKATLRAIEGRNHQFNDDLSAVAQDIRRLGR